MIIGIAEDFTSSVSLDAELSAVPTSGLYLNSGVHPSITIENLLEFLPSAYEVSNTWSNAVTYGVFSDSRSKNDLVVLDEKIYQSIKGANLNNSPDVVGSEYWIETNIESLMLKNLIYKTIDKFKFDLNLTKRLINNQYLYEDGAYEVTLPNDYAAWIFEPKGSDYVSFTINQISFQKKGTTPVNLYVVNQGVLIDTLTITPSNGIIDFKEVNYSFSGKGKWMFIIDSTDVLTSGNTIDPLRYDGFVAYTATGTGDNPETAQYNYGSQGNGLGFNISLHLDTKVYLDNNISTFGNFIRACFEYVVFQMFLHNSNNKSNRAERIQMNEEILIAELKNTNADTVVKRFYNEKKRAVKQLEKTFDSQLENNNDFEIEIGTI